MKNIFIGLVLLWTINSCTKYEAVFLEKKIPDSVKLNYFPYDEYSKWVYRDKNAYETEFVHSGVSTNPEEEGFVKLGHRNRMLRNFGGSAVWESYSVKRTDNVVIFKTKESYNFLVELELIPYPIILPTQNVNAGDEWSKNINIEYTQYDQLNAVYINNLVYNTTMHYKILGVNETKTVNSKSYENVISYRIDYLFGGMEMFREIMLAEGVGLISFEDQDDKLELIYYN